MFEALPDLPATRRWREQGYPVASVLALIRRERANADGAIVAHYLLIQRQKEPYAGKWALVGGRWEFGERLDVAITREVQEETGLDTTFVALRGLVGERIAPRGPDDEGAHFLLFVCEVAAPDGVAREQAEGPVAWFSLAELEKLAANRQIVSTDHQILRHFGGTSPAIPFVEAAVVASAASDVDRLVAFDPPGAA
jgi:8-oxo-dGTP diphosphatase